MANGNSDTAAEQFLERIINAFFDFLKDKSYQKPSALRSQLEDMVNYFKRGRSNKPFGLRKELQAQFGGGEKGYLDFLNELLKKSYGVQLRYDKDAKKFAVVDNPTNPPAVLPEKINLFDLLRLAEQYTPPSIRFPTRRDRTEITSEVASASFVNDPLSTVFDSRFESTSVCTKNKQRHSLAGFQDAADPFTHRLRVTRNTKKNDGTLTESMLEVTLIECFSEDHLHATLVGGIQGSIKEDDKRALFQYAYWCLQHYATVSDTVLYFNLNFNPKSQREPMDFINTVGNDVLGIFVYTLIDGEYKLTDRGKEKTEELNYPLLAITTKDLPAFSSIHVPRRLRKKGMERSYRHSSGIKRHLGRSISNPDDFLDDFASERRYADSWQPYEFKTKRNSNHPQWNVRTGEVSAIKLDRNTIKKLWKKEYIQITSVGEKILMGLLTPLVAFAFLDIVATFVDLPSLHPYCSDAVVQQYTISCVNDDKVQEFPIETLQDIELRRSVNGTKFLATAPDSKRYAILLKRGNRYSEAFFSALALKGAMEQYLAQVGKQADANVESFKNFLNTPIHQPRQSAIVGMHGAYELYSEYIAASTRDLHLLMRMRTLQEAYGFSDITESFSRRIVEELYRSRSSEGIERTLTAVSTLTGDDVKNWIAGRSFAWQDADTIASFLYETARRGDPDIDREALVLVDRLAKDGYFQLDQYLVFLPPNPARDLLSIFSEGCGSLPDDFVLDYLTCLNKQAQQPLSDRTNACSLPILCYPTSKL
ncbi:hypothetical protein HYU19_02765 [Candidatus Woesearchaeota archaeon]|nr:hypothetical protein [Candidatus Woesearchaeota archaeon]